MWISLDFLLIFLLHGSGIHEIIRIRADPGPMYVFKLLDLPPGEVEDSRVVLLPVGDQEAEVHVPQNTEHPEIKWISKGGRKKNLDFLEDMSPKLWPHPLAPLGNKKKDFFSRLYTYTNRTGFHWYGQFLY